MGAKRLTFHTGTGARCSPPATQVHQAKRNGCNGWQRGSVSTSNATLQRTNPRHLCPAPPHTPPANLTNGQEDEGEQDGEDANLERKGVGDGGRYVHTLEQTTGAQSGAPHLTTPACCLPAHLRQRVGQRVLALPLALAGPVLLGLVLTPDALALLVGVVCAAAAGKVGGQRFGAKGWARESAGQPGTRSSSA